MASAARSRGWAWDAAIEHLQTAVDLRRAGEGDADKELAQTLFDFARVLDERPEGAARAIEAAREASAMVSTANGDPARALREEIEAWLRQHHAAR